VVTTLQSTSGRWVPPGEPAAVGGHVIPGGLIYLGQRLPGDTGPAEPTLIDPDLPVSASPGHYAGPDSGAELAYHLLSPVTRKAYLQWQAGGRRTEVAPGLVRLFCFGLERRVLVDWDVDPAVQRELPALTAEAYRLRARYGAAGTSLREALDHLLDLLELLTAQRAAPEPDRETPMAVRIALARFAVSSTPVPVAWARAWMRHHPSLAPSRSESDCPAEFDRLFTLRYRDRYGTGLVPAGGGAGIRLRYQPANPGLATTLVCRPDLPDLLSERRDIRALATLRDEVAAVLDPYRRWLARFPQGRDSLAAVPLLPAELIDVRHGRLGSVRVWSERRLDGQARALIDAGEFWDFWSAASPERMATDEAAALLAVLAKLDLGVEPDVRFGAPPLAPGSAVLFRLGRPAADRPGAHFASAAAIARCAAAVASAARPIDPREPAGTALLASTADLAAALRLEPGEDLRLAARLSWLLTTRVDVDRLGRLTTMMTVAEREVAGHFLVTAAVLADPVIGPATVMTLTRVYRILGLQVDLVFQRLHERSTGGGPLLPRIAGAEAPPVPASRRAQEAAGLGGAGFERSDEPVVVQAGSRQPSGYALPWAPPSAADAGTPSTGLRLDRSLIRKKVADSDTAAALLGTIFETEEPIGDPEPPVAVPGLDRAHDALLHALGERPSWTRAEFESLAAVHGVMPDGALDLLNEVAIDTTGEPLVEGGATLTVANDVLRELLA
jgi:hypothetical protein